MSRLSDITILFTAIGGAIDKNVGELDALTKMSLGIIQPKLAIEASGFAKTLIADKNQWKRYNGLTVISRIRR